MSIYATEKQKNYLEALRRAHPAIAQEAGLTEAIPTPETRRVVGDFIERIKRDAQPYVKPFPAGSKSGIMAEILRRNRGSVVASCRDAREALPPHDLFGATDDELRAFRLCFERNNGGERKPLRPHEQHDKLIREVKRIREIMVGQGETFGGTEIPPAPVPEPTPIPGPEAEGFRGTAELYRKCLNRLRELDRKRGGVYALDSQRALIEGLKALSVGLPMEGLFASLTAAWTDEAREQANVAKFDYTKWGRENGSPKDAHGASEYVARLVKADIPALLTGPAGTGKSTNAKYAAKQAGLNYYEVNLAGAMASAIKGKDRLKEFIVSQFTVAYSEGGLLCIEEMDAAHPTVLTAINNAIAGDEFWNDADGKVHKRHPDFRIVATANTLGTGATKQYNGRNKLDGATLDRFRLGTVIVPLDPTLEDHIFATMVAALS